MNHTTEVNGLRKFDPRADQNADTGRQSAKWLSIVRWVSILIILLALATIIRSLPLDRGLAAMNDWLAGLGVWGPVVLAGIYVVATVLFVPGTILTLAAGAMFGLVVGFIAVSVGSTAGAASAFLISRYLARDRVAAMAQGDRRFGAIDRAIGEGGWKIVALLRMSPAIPFNMQNYLYGLTPIRFWPFLLTSWLAMMPGTFLYVYLGHITGAAVGTGRARGPVEWAMLAVGLLATIAVTVYVTKLARRKLQEQMEQSAPEEQLAEPASKQPPNATRTVAMVIVAVCLSLAAVYARAKADTIEGWLTGLFGPPQVEMQEAYADSDGSRSFDHTAFGKLLEAHVDADGWIDYVGLQRDEAQLDAYLEDLANAPFDELGRDEKLALLINAYNAFTLKLILEHYPLESIMDIPEDQRWEAQRWNVGGNRWSLNQIEHEQIRPKFVEPRIHFA
ncbi:MAG: VTT domain-containing protein, partial [Pirellulales bacterium]